MDEQLNEQKQVNKENKKKAAILAAILFLGLGTCISIPLAVAHVNSGWHEISDAEAAKIIAKIAEEQGVTDINDPASMLKNSNRTWIKSLTKNHKQFCINNHFNAYYGEYDTYSNCSFDNELYDETNVGNDPTLTTDDHPKAVYMLFQEGIGLTQYFKPTKESPDFVIKKVLDSSVKNYEEALIKLEEFMYNEADIYVNDSNAMFEPVFAFATPSPSHAFGHISPLEFIALKDNAVSNANPVFDFTPLRYYPSPFYLCHALSNMSEQEAENFYNEKIMASGFLSAFNIDFINHKFFTAGNYSLRIETSYNLAFTVLKKSPVEFSCTTNAEFVDNLLQLNDTKLVENYGTNCLYKCTLDFSPIVEVPHDDWRPDPSFR